MTMPMGASGIEPDAWMQSYTVTGTPNALLAGLSDLHTRTRTNVEESLYSTNIDQNQDWTDIFDWFLNLAEGVISALPEWLAPLKTVLLWVGEFFTENLRGTFNTLGTFFAWLAQNITDPLTQGLTGALKWLWDAFKGTADRLNTTATAIFQGIFGFLNWLWAGTGIEGAFVGFAQSIDSVLKPLLEWLNWLWVSFGSGVETFLKPVFLFLDWLWNGVAGGFAGLGDAVGTVLKPIVEWLTWLFGGLWDGLPPPNLSAAPIVSAFLTPIAQVLKNVWDGLGTAAATIGSTAQGMFEGLFDFLTWLWQQFGAAVETVLKPAANFLNWLMGQFNLAGLQDIFGTFKSIIGTFGSMFDWLQGIPGPTDLLGIVQSITGKIAETIGEAFYNLVDWAQNIPIIGPLVGSLTQGWINPATGTSNTLTDLVAWASRQLDIDSVVPSWNLIGDIPKELIALLPIGHISDAKPNLVTDQSFAYEAALQAGSGWSWDGSKNYTGSSGSAKVKCDGGVKQLFSNLIECSPGQVLDVSVQAAWTNASISANPQLVVGIRGYAGDVVKYTNVVSGFFANTMSSSTHMSATNGWVNISGSHTVPTNLGITQVRMYMGVNNGPSGSYVWFDEAITKKTNLLPQDLVKELTVDLGSKLPNTDFNDLLNRVAKKTGATLQDVTNAVTNFLTTGSYLNGSNIKSGNISSEFINELKKTWSEVIYFGATNGSTAPADTLGLASQELKTLANNVANLGGLVNGMSPLISGNTSRISSAETAIQKLQTDVYNLQVKVATTPTVQPPVGSTIVTVFDDFERSSLGANWGSPYLAIADGSSLGIKDGHDAWFFPPTVTTQQSYATAIWSGTGSVSNSVYQRIYATIGMKGSIPLFGSVGYNDLVARANGVNYCIICRFYPDGRVQFIYRNGNTYSDGTNVFGNFTSPTPIGAGAMIEFKCGDKASGNEKMCYAKVGTSLIGPAYFPTISNIGKGWGFGMGNGISLAAAQSPGTLNYWGAEDQT